MTLSLTDKQGQKASILPEGFEYVKQLRGKRTAFSVVQVIAVQVPSASQIS